MRQRLLAAPLASLGLALAATPAVADDHTGFYIGGSVGKSGVEYDRGFNNLETNFDADSTGWKAVAGWRFVDWLAIEANYIDFGKSDDRFAGGRVDTDITGVSLAAVAFVPVGPVDLFARVGAVKWDVDFDINNDDEGLPDVSASDDGTDLTYGVGAQFRFGNNFALRAEYERFDVDGPDRLDLISAGFTYSF